MPRLYDDSDQERLHLKAMQALVTETGHEFESVREVYEAQLARLREQAHITDFVVLLSSRRTREALRGSAISNRSQAAHA
ncbi:MAG: DUF3562 domain-containing protein [Burkholderiales bacterium]|nr:DUF3562 domain-containing protein [Burkholderiales bacterium]